MGRRESKQKGNEGGAAGCVGHIAEGVAGDDATRLELKQEFETAPTKTATENRIEILLRSAK